MIWGDMLKALSTSIIGVLVVGVSGAITAHISSRFATSRQRTRIKEDIELVEKLKVGSTARNHLEASIEERLLRLSFQDYYDNAITAIRWFFALSVLVGTVTTVAAAFAARPDERDEAILANAGFWYGAFLFISIVTGIVVWSERRAAGRNRAKYFAEGQYPDPIARSPDKQPGRLRARGATRLRRLTAKRRTNNTIPLPMPETAETAPVQLDPPAAAS